MLLHETELTGRFRQYYNATIFPELLRLEQRRRSAVLGTIGAGLIFSVLLVVELTLSMPLFTFLLVLIGGGVFYYFYLKIEQFRRTFKPQVVGAVLDFLDNQVGYDKLVYRPDGMLSEALFNKSLLFTTYNTYQGEDQIAGKIGELPFELSELQVERVSPTRSRTDTVFRGVMIHVVSGIDNAGDMLIIPRTRREEFADTIERFVKMGGRVVNDALLSKAFMTQYYVLATPNAWIDTRFSPEMEADLLSYQIKTGRDLAFSFIGKDIFIAFWQERDLLEPHIWRDNTSFELVKEFFDDLRVLFDIVRDLDRSN